LREGAYYSRIRCPYDCPHADYVPEYRPVEWPKTHDILSRAVVFGLDIIMDESRLQKMASGINEGFEAAFGG
jgi:8-amino-3,8-dideoxy-alpha-D-manno-octulosonate transaminase